MNTPQIFLTIILLFSSSFFALAHADEALTEVNLQLKWRHQFQFAGYYAAIEKGFYQEKGLKVKLLERVPGPTPIDQLIFGQVDYAIGGVGAIIYRMRDIPIVALAANFQNSPSILISRYPDLQQLKNKKVMLSEGQMNAEIIAMLAFNGLSLSDINVVPSNQSMDGFINDEHDAYNAYITNETYFLKQKNIPFYVFKPSDYSVDFYSDILLTMEKTIRDNPQQVEDFRAASIQGWYYAIEHVEEIIDLILAKYNTQNKSREQLQHEADELIKLMHADIVPIGYMNEKRWQKISKILTDFGDNKETMENFSAFIYQKPNNYSLLTFIRYNFKEIVVAFGVLIAFLLLFHNQRLKLIVKERTQQLEDAKIKAEQDARTDALTDLANLRHFTEVINHYLSIAQRNNLSLSIMTLDIDHFKKVNDTYGHAAGDEALKKVAKVIKRNVRISDTAARTGGEEFIVISLDKNQEDFANLAERIRQDIENEQFEYQNQRYQLTISIGLTQLKANESTAELIKRSDQALYKAKNKGRNTTVSL